VRSFGASLALQQTLIGALLLGVLFLSTFYLTRLHLWQGLKVVAVAKHTRLLEALGEGYVEMKPEELAARLRRISGSLQPQFYVEVQRAGSGRLFATANLRGNTLADASRSDNVYRRRLPNGPEVFVHTFRDGPITFRIAQGLESANIILAAYTRGAVILFLGALGLNAFHSIWSARQAMRPIVAIQRAAERISSENLGERIPIGSSGNEIEALAVLLNRTFGRLEASFEQIRQFTADASHELKTPLAVARARAERLLRQRGLTDEQRDEAVEGILAEILQLEKIIEDLLLLARSDAHSLPVTPRAQSTEDFWREVIGEVGALAEFHGIRLVLPERGEGEATFDRRWMRHVVLNLVSNAIRHSPRGGSITLRSKVAQGRWSFAVEDEGSGVPPGKLEKIFERFYQVRTDGRDTIEGTGLGLAICRSLVERHRGEIRAMAGAGARGLAVQVELPAAAS
jgi:two-component system heavy metal sensor histidine kinase CusS